MFCLNKSLRMYKAEQGTLYYLTAISTSFYSTCPAQPPRGCITLIRTISLLLCGSDLLEMKSHFLHVPGETLVEVHSGQHWHCFPFFIFTFPLIGLPPSIVSADMTDTCFENGFIHSMKIRWPLLYRSTYFHHKGKLAIFRDFLYIAFVSVGFCVVIRVLWWKLFF